jgi:hypothetical protein
MEQGGFCQAYGWLFAGGVGKERFFGQGGGGRAGVVFGGFPVRGAQEGVNSDQ